jgi:hypothetical protein
MKINKILNPMGTSITVLGSVLGFTYGYDYVQFNLRVKDEELFMHCVAPAHFAEAVRESYKKNSPIIIEGGFDGNRNIALVWVNHLYFSKTNYGIKYDDTFLLSGPL